MNWYIKRGEVHLNRRADKMPVTFLSIHVYALMDETNGIIANFQSLICEYYYVESTTNT